ncbi:MAG TPA: sigma-70 family RNA polymerase sigma factor [Vicinamibacterales bacterium]|nr:sigma-70 family RNA polymerase sigma factor [Vicinamibacterales bacterium]
MDSGHVEDLIRRLRVNRRDHAAWNELYRQLWPFVFGVTYRRLRGAKGLAEDAAQETFIKLLRSLPFDSLHGADDLRAYIWRAADNVARDFFRKSMQMEARLVHPEGDVIDEPTTDIGADDRLRLTEWVEHTLLELPSTDRTILKMLIEGNGLTEIAEATGLTYSAAGSRVSRLRDRLRSKLKTQI